jgi:hypothetical protein
MKRGESLGFLDFLKKKNAGLGDIPKPPPTMQQPAQQPQQFNIRKYDDLSAASTTPESMPPLPSFDLPQQNMTPTYNPTPKYEDFIPYKYDPIEEPHAEDFGIPLEQDEQFKPYPPQQTQQVVAPIQQVAQPTALPPPIVQPPQLIPPPIQSPVQIPSPKIAQPLPPEQFLPPEPVMNRKFELYVSATDYDTFVTTLKDMTKRLKTASDELSSYDEQDAKFKKEMNTFHDALDFMQKKLMYVDSVLFE